MHIEITIKLGEVVDIRTSFISFLLAESEQVN